MLKHTTFFTVLLGLSSPSFGESTDTVNIDLIPYCVGKTDKTTSITNQYEKCISALTQDLTGIQVIAKALKDLKAGQSTDVTGLTLPDNCNGLTDGATALTLQIQHCVTNLNKQKELATVIWNGLANSGASDKPSSTDSAKSNLPKVCKDKSGSATVITEQLDECIKNLRKELHDDNTTAEKKAQLENQISEVSELAKEAKLEACEKSADMDALFKTLITKDKWDEGKTNLKTKLTEQMESCVAAHQIAKDNNSSDDLEKTENQLVALRDDTQSLSRRVVNHFALDKDSSLSYKQQSELNDIQKEITTKINKALEFNLVDYVIPPFRDEAFTFQFYAGLEATKLSEILEQTNGRVGFQGYHRLTRKMEKAREYVGPKCRQDKPCSKWSWPGLHLFGSATLINVGENTFVTPKPADTDTAGQSDTMDDMTGMTNDQNTDDPNMDMTDGTSDMPDNQPTDTQGADMMEEELDQVLIAELGLFAPVYSAIRGDVTKDNYQEFMVGPIVTAGLNINDGDQDNFRSRYYWGIRYAHNEETYLDILHGKNEGIAGKRMEVRGQLPVTDFSGGRLFLGGRFNFGIDEHKKENNDAWQIYMQWQTSFDELWKRSE